MIKIFARLRNKLRWSKIRLPHKLLLVYTPLIILPALTGIYYVTSKYTTSSQQLTETYATDLLHLLARKIDDRLLSYEQLSKQIITDGELHKVLMRQTDTSYQTYQKESEMNERLNVLWLGDEQNNYIRSIKINTDNEMFTYGENAINDYGVEEPAYSLQIHLMKGSGMWFAPQTFTDGYRSFQAFRLGRTIRDDKLNELGAVTLVVEVAAITDIFEETVIQNDVVLQLTDERGDVLITNDHSIEELGGEILTFTEENIRDGWRLVAELPLAPLYEPIYQTVKNALLVVFICIALGLIVTQLLATDVVRPIRKLMNNMQLGIKGIKPKELKHFHGAIEIVEMNDTFISVMYEIEQLMQKGALQEQKKKNAEIRALQNQLSPHFLYNTLNSIRWMAMIQKQNNIKKMVDSLIKLLTYSVRNTGEPVPLREEIAMMHNYVNIQKVRFRHFSFVVTIDPLIDEALILKFLLQPLIENALIHGLAKAEHPGEIELTGQLENEHVHLAVSDNGVGMTEQYVETLKQSILNANETVHEHFGLRSIHERIQLHYGERFGIDLQSEWGRGTTVAIRYPYRTLKDGEQDA